MARLVNEHGFDIKQFKVVELNNRNYVYYLVMDEKLKTEVDQFIIDTVEKDFGSCQITVKTCDRIVPCAKTGKMCIFERKY
ncbi:hypothetical protein [Eubacterium xylanophilum]|uniref:hypothetical protein n=1 Tax=Eubacterium xylanophilum TaxID=39497 RepID=UPI001A9995D1|nr:hypothetical protein [Eubacterium xylanophilum]